MWIKVIKVYGFLLFSSFLYTEVIYRFPHKKMNPTPCSENLSNSACNDQGDLTNSLPSVVERTFIQTLPWCHKLEAISEKISKQLWFQLHSHTAFVLLKDSQNTRNLRVIYLKYHFLEFHKVVRRHISGEVDQFTTFWCDVSSRLRITKIIEIGPVLSYSKKNKKVAAFLRHSVV